MNGISDVTIGCIGTGNMGSALILGLTNAIQAKNISAYDINTKRLNILSSEYGIIASKSIEQCITSSDIIILAVKPQIISNVLTEIKDISQDKIIISIAAGVSIDAIEKILTKNREIIRVMPNTPALIGEGMSVLSPNSKADEETIKKTEAIFATVGETLILPESLMDAVTGLSGCGPAYIFTLIQGMSDAGVKMGIPRDKAQLLATQTVIGSAKLVLQSKEDPISLRGKVTSPGGSTIDAVHVLEKAGFSGIIIDAIEMATEKSKNLGGN